MTEAARTTTLGTRALTVQGRRPARATTPKQWILSGVGILILAVMLFPVYWMINISLQPAGPAIEAAWFPIHAQLHGYAQAIADQGGALVTSLLIALGSVVVSLVIATPASYALAQFKVKGVGAVLFGILISQMIPGIVVANALYAAYNDLGLLNTIPGLILADSTAGVPFAILIMRAFMQNIPPSIIEAAKVDGAGNFRAFRSVVIPISFNALITAGLFTFLFTWSDFLFALTLTTTGDVRPITLGIYNYIGTFTADWSTVMAAAVMASIPAIVLLLVAQKFIAAGATGGAVK
ncbi:carbohydrate ABC transporter membrane protein 2 (CUT1 family) [Curtobacterium sp. PhB130]|uniref:carbohydrate ABC transporter permease n=1 Tax=unclassified Curtobacterium TaxID=257496 RepID=UPI000F4B0BAD|nr:MULTISPECIES: carbohydrate ABC transporter permease [unclassified Curtobacterium]ROS75113.1 carbohydrate ABC transporter membrane protein 2 (CUT1 family) [Curtobacterium sp. PhB130]TCK63741.1 carbohydrate ABC transporter membrane protein 2 (CUT1 family) [Curtobacterium sp. PhB136]